MAVNRFVLNGISYHGHGAINEIPGIVKGKGFKKAFVASDPDLVKFGVTAKVTDLLEKNGIEYHIVKTYKNGVRVGYVPKHDKKAKKSGIGQAWFPKSWTQKDITKAAEHVSQLKCNKGVKDGIPVFPFEDAFVIDMLGNINDVFCPQRKESRLRLQNQHHRNE